MKFNYLSHFYRSLLIFFVHFFMTLSPCYSMENEDFLNQRSIPQMPFKLGFEFQEGSALCPWALKDNRIQKKPLFSLNIKGTAAYSEDEIKNFSLWHVVIDTSDIEFVTKPFTDIKSLGESINSIVLSFNILENLLTDKTFITFENWVYSLQDFINIHSPNKFEITFIESNFNRIRDKNIVKPSGDWEPIFSPQVTIQHPLEYTIPLYFGLFGFKNSSYMMPFLASLPFIDLFKKAHEEANSQNLRQVMSGYEQKVSGLTFLHALTLVQMTPNEEETESSFLAETLKTFTDYQQIDAKMRLTLMSRRPFSSMLNDINPHNKEGYKEIFVTAMLKFNFDRFNLLYNVPKLFYKSNYAEQFFDDSTGREKSLLHLLPLFEEEFSKENEDLLKSLLEKGIVSTAMLRNLKHDVMEENSKFIFNNSDFYFNKVMDSVVFPEERYILDTENGMVKKIPCDHDSLSPPWFSESNNSMGALKDALKEEEKVYGEAIIEIRAIKNVGSWFFKRVGLSPEIEGKFLMRPNNIPKEAETLFRFLEDFGTIRDVEDIKVGMTYAVFRK